jgi:uncharacterized protein YqeY
MTLEQRLRDDLKGAVKKGDEVRRSVIRMVMAGVKNAEIDRRAGLEDADVLGILAREVRQRRESIDAFSKGDRWDLVAQEEAELAVLLEYLPQQISRQEIAAAAWEVIAEVGAKGPRDKGKVMPRIIAQLKGKADGRDINEVVTQLLAGSSD